jgi:diguanylate cyclase (GGDEF)-like protein
LGLVGGETMDAIAPEAAGGGAGASLESRLGILAQAIDASADGFAIWQVNTSAVSLAHDFSLLISNKAATELTQKSPVEILGGTLEQAYGAEHASVLSLLFNTALTTKTPKKEVLSDSVSDGVVGFFELTAVPFGSNMVLLTSREVSEDYKERSRLLWLTQHDFLTGMPNRAKLQQVLEGALSSAQQAKTLAAFVFIDIDHFKAVNDRFGHDVGDAVLVNFVKRIQHSLPSSAFVARISGDEFAIVLTQLKGEKHLVELMVEVFEAMQRPFDRDAIQLNISCSAGCVLTDGALPADEVMRVADKAMYRAKHLGRNRFEVEVLAK